MSDEVNKIRVYVAPRSEAERKLAAIWEKVLGHAQIGVHDDFFGLGGQSIIAARMIVAIEREFGVRTNISVVFKARTVKAMAKLLESPDELSNSVLVPLQETGTKRPLFLVHCGGGHLLRYGEFVEAMPDDQPIYGFAAPPLGRALEELSVEDLAQRYLGELRKVQPHGPYQIGGYSFGGLVAYEMARMLSDEGETIGLLAILDTSNHTHYWKQPRIQRLRMKLTHYAEVVSRYAGNLMAGRFVAIRENLIETVSNRYRDFGWMLGRVLNSSDNAPSAFGIEDNLPAFAAIRERYVPGNYSGRMALFYAEGRGWEYRSNPSLGWTDVVSGEVEVLHIPGDHYTFLQPPNVQGLIAKLLDSQNRTDMNVDASTKSPPDQT